MKVIIDFLLYVGIAWLLYIVYIILMHIVTKRTKFGLGELALCVVASALMCKLWIW